MWCNTLYEAGGIQRDDAIWNIPEHVGLQMFHAFDQAQGHRRKFSNADISDDAGTWESFRDQEVPDDDEDSDTLKI